MNQQDKAFETLKYSVAEFDKNIVYIASGALGISFSFVDKVVKLDSAIGIDLLISAWYCFAITIFVSLISHFISVLGNRWDCVNRPPDDNQDDVIEEAYSKTMKKWNITIRGSNILMVCLLFVGIILLLSFIRTNLKNNMSENKPKGQIENNQSGKTESGQINQVEKTNLGYIGESKQQQEQIRKGAELSPRPIVIKPKDK